MTPRFQEIVDPLPLPVNVGTHWPMTEEQIRTRAPELAALLSALIPPGVCEVRGIGPSRTEFHTDPVALCAAALRMSSRHQAVYYTLGEIDPATPARKERGQATAEADAVRRRWIVFDLDLDRPKGAPKVSASDVEKEACYRAALAVVAHLTQRGWPEPIIVDSGNGYHLCYRVDLSPDAGPLVAGCLAAIGSAFPPVGDHPVKIDPANALVVPHLLVKFPGTLAAKGPDTLDRPHRTSGIVSKPATVELVPTRLLIDLASEAVTAEKSRATAATPGDPSDSPLDDFCARGSWEETGLPDAGWTVCQDRGGGRMYLTRPGKGGDVSASIGFSRPDHYGHPTFWVFTTSSSFKDGKAYSKAQVYAHLNHGDDISAAAKALRAMGYGRKGPEATFAGQSAGGTRAGDPKPGSPGANQQPGATAKPVLLRLSDVTAEAIRWTWDRRFPCGRLSIVCGHPGASKSVFTMMMAATVSTGGWWPDRTRAPLGDVLLLSSEDGIADTVRPRLDVAEADCSRVLALTAAAVIDREGKEKEVALTMANVDVIRDALRQMNGPKLVVVDPVGSYLGGGVDAHRDNEVRAVLAPMAALAEEFDVAIVLVAHTTKAKPTRADDGILGSRAFSGIVRCTHHIGTDPDDTTGKRLFFLPGKNNLGPRMSGLAYRVESAPHEVGSQPVLSFEPDPVEMGADDAFGGDSGGGGGKPGPEPVKRDAAATWLVAVLRNEPQSKAVIEEEAKAAGPIPAKTLRNAREFLGVESYKSGLSGCYFWRLPVGFDLSEYPAEDGAGCPSSEAEVAPGACPSNPVVLSF